DRAVGDAAFGIDDVGRGQPGHGVLLDHAGIAVQEQGEIDRIVGEKGEYRILVFTNVDPEKDYAFVQGFFRTALHRRHFVATGRAPGRPEIQHYDFAAIIGQLVQPIVEIRQ